ncbi:MAG: hypothetical protein JWO00_436 [Candidatus Parcubacteria bacterium]|nr:hypothetical protein [Candidatus Parcubacteria bacterium]
MIKSLQYLLQRMPIDLGQGSFHHKTKGKRIALALIPDRSNYASGQQPTALDIGCNDGYYSEILKKRGYKTTSIDVFRNYESVIIADADKTLPFPDNSFDVIWSTEVIEHLKDPNFTISEIRRMLKPEGIAVLTTPNSHFWLYPVLWTLFKITPKQAQNQPHLQFFSIDDIRKLRPSHIYGFFPYILLKFRIARLVGPLSPTFVFSIAKK